MPSALIDDFSNETLWQALTPTDAPSAEITLTTDAPSPALPTGGLSMRAAFSATSADHRIERAIGPIDLSGSSELRFWVRASQLATGAPTAPFRLSMGIGSAPLPIGAVGNDWLRHIPAPEGGRWDLVRVALDDLAPGIRSAASRIAFRALPVAPAASGFTIWYDELRAVAPRMAADANMALVAALDGGLQLGGAPVTASLDAPGAPAVAPPFIRLVNYDAAFAERRGGQGRRRADFTDAGHRIWPEPEPWDLFYRIDFVTADPTEQAAMLDFTLATLGGRGLLDIGGSGHLIERVPNVMPDDALAASPVLRYRLATWLERGAPVTVQPVGEIRVTTDALA